MIDEGCRTSDPAVLAIGEAASSRCVYGCRGTRVTVSRRTVFGRNPGPEDGAVIVLVRDDLMAVPDALMLSRATLRTIRINLGWAFGYNVAAIPLAAADTGEADGFTAPDLAGQSIMLVAPHSIEASLISRRLQRWGAQTCIVSDDDVAEALLPERSWHTVLIDHTLGTQAIEAFAEAARIHVQSDLQASQ